MMVQAMTDRATIQAQLVRSRVKHLTLRMYSHGAMDSRDSGHSLDSGLSPLKSRALEIMLGAGIILEHRRVMREGMSNA